MAYFLLDRRLDHFARTLSGRRTCEVRNGLLLWEVLRTLFDKGYITITMEEP